VGELAADGTERVKVVDVAAAGVVGLVKIRHRNSLFVERTEG
jgi:hypothetical protein